jgi:hypothetical protein
MAPLSSIEWIGNWLVGYMHYSFATLSETRQGALGVATLLTSTEAESNIQMLCRIGYSEVSELNRRHTSSRVLVRQ